MGKLKCELFWMPYLGDSNSLRPGFLPCPVCFGFPNEINTKNWNSKQGTKILGGNCQLHVNGVSLWGLYPYPDQRQGSAEASTQGDREARLDSYLLYLHTYIFLFYCLFIFFLLLLFLRISYMSTVYFFTIYIPPSPSNSSYLPTPPLKFISSSFINIIIYIKPTESS